MKQSEISQLTKTRLASSLKKHMEQKPLEKITVRELTEDCKLNRQTFYYHFQDIYELTTWMFRQEAMELLNKKEDWENWQEGLWVFLNYVEANKSFWKCALDSVGQVNLKEIFYEDAAHLIYLVIQEEIGSLKVSTDYIEFISNFYIEAVLIEVIRWVNGTLNVDANKLMQYLEATLHDNLKSSLKKAAEWQL